LKGIEFSVWRPGWEGPGAAEKGRSKKFEDKSGQLVSGTDIILLKPSVRPDFYE